ncbi:hypothetical protein T09_12258 [Trichinella sp. T9]|nr:hypothetical protein T09_12258 [Trichinella sp. T9]
MKSDPAGSVKFSSLCNLTIAYFNLELQFKITDVVALDFLVAYERFSGRIEDALILRICKIFQLVMIFRIAIRNSSVR